MEMLLFCLPKPGSFQPGWDSAVLEAKREAGVKQGNAGCGGTAWAQVLPQGSTLGPGCLWGDTRRNRGGERALVQSSYIAWSYPKAAGLLLSKAASVSLMTVSHSPGLYTARLYQSRCSSLA